MNLDWAVEELKRAGYDINDPEDGPNKWLAESVIELLVVFGGQGHSGSSAPHAVELFKNLAMWKPLAPLTGEDDEWNEVGDGVFQNKRDGRVFKEKDGKAYCLDMIVFWEWYSSPDIDDGKPYKSYFTSKDSHKFIEFPWKAPEQPEYVFVPTETFPNEVLDGQ